MHDLRASSVLFFRARVPPLFAPMAAATLCLAGDGLVMFDGVRFLADWLVRSGTPPDG